MSSYTRIPGRVHAVYGIKGSLARSFAYSRQFNRRNLEFLWYPLWDHVLHNTFQDIGNAIIAPQFPVYLNPSDMQELTDEQASQDPNNSQRPPGIQPPFAEPDGVERLPDSISTYSQGITAALPKASSQIIDTAILALRSRKTKDDIWRYGGYRITDVSIPVIYEFKKSGHRGNTPGEIATDAEQLVVQMADQVITQAAYVFAMFPHMQKLIAVSGVGDYWAYTTIHRRLHVSEAELTKIRQGRSRKQIIVKVRDTVKIDEWSSAVPLGSSESQTRLDMIHDFVKECTCSPLHDDIPNDAEAASDGDTESDAGARDESGADNGSITYGDHNIASGGHVHDGDADKETPSLDGLGYTPTNVTANTNDLQPISSRHDRPNANDDSHTQISSDHAPDTYAEGKHVGCEKTPGSGEFGHKPGHTKPNVTAVKAVDEATIPCSAEAAGSSTKPEFRKSDRIKEIQARRLGDTTTVGGHSGDTGSSVNPGATKTKPKQRGKKGSRRGKK